MLSTAPVISTLFVNALSSEILRSGFGGIEASGRQRRAPRGELDRDVARRRIRHIGGNRERSRDTLGTRKRDALSLCRRRETGLTRRCSER